jgi:hypothetical protein
MTRPIRIPLRRTKGWRMPTNTISVARPGRWGNPYVVTRFGMVQTGDWDENGISLMHGPWRTSWPGNGFAGFWFSTKQEAIAKAVELYRWRMTEPVIKEPLRERLHELRGKNLACWCPLPALGEPDLCHADVLLDLANRERQG